MQDGAQLQRGRVPTELPLSFVPSLAQGQITFLWKPSQSPPQHIRKRRKYLQVSLFLLLISFQLFPEFGWQNVLCCCHERCGEQSWGSSWASATSPVPACASPVFFLGSGAHQALLLHPDSPET